MALPFPNRERLMLFDADGTIIDAFSAIDTTFAAHGMDIGELEAFQKRRKVFKYVGGLKEFPLNIKKHQGKKSSENLRYLDRGVSRTGMFYPGGLNCSSRFADKTIRLFCHAQCQSRARIDHGAFVCALRHRFNGL